MMSVVGEIIERGLRHAEEAYRYVKEDSFLSGVFEVASNIVQNFLAKSSALLFLLFACLVVGVLVVSFHRSRAGFFKYLRDTAFLVLLVIGIGVCLREPVFLLPAVIIIAIVAYLKASDPLGLTVLPKWSYAESPAPDEGIS
jgi:hypothetical protein